MNYSYNPCDGIISFINSDFSKECCSRFLNDVGYTDISCILDPCTAVHAVLVDKSTNYTFTSIEIEWLHSVNLLTEYKVSDNTTIVIADMNCSIDDYYINCAAIIKIFEKAFAHNSFYIFKIRNSLSFGCLINANIDIPNNYIISMLCNETNMSEVTDFIEELFVEEMDSLPSLISDYSPLKTQGNDEYYKTYSDELVYDENEYIKALLEIQSFYGVDTSKARERSSLPKEERDLNQVLTDCTELKSVANEIDQKTSYEELLSASAAKENATSNTETEELQLSFFDEDLQIVSDDAYKDAEKMLKELLGK